MIKLRTTSNISLLHNNFITNMPRSLLSLCNTTGCYETLEVKCLIYDSVIDHFRLNVPNVIEVLVLVA